MPGNRMTIRIKALAENIGVVRVAVAAFAAQMDFTLTEIEEIKVAVSEAVSNVVLHAYSQEGDLTVDVDLSGDVLEIVVQDQGRGIPDVAKARQASFSTEPGRMGLGFVFMESFMDHLEVSSLPGEGTRVRMTRKPQKTQEKAV